MAGVTLLVVGVIAVERGYDGLQEVLVVVRDQLPQILLGLAPLMCGLGIAWGWAQMDAYGEMDAFHLSGVGPVDFMKVAVTVGCLVGLMGLILGECVLPMMAPSREALWLWTEHGPQRTSDGLMVLLNDGGRVVQASVSAVDRALLHPRSASIFILDWQAPGAVGTEWASRFARIPACIGFALLAVAASQQTKPMLTMICVGGALIVVDLVGWAMGAHGHMPPLVAGSLLAWTWMVPFAVLYRQSVNRTQCPE